MSKLPDMKALMQKAMMAHVIFAAVSFRCNGWAPDECFTVIDSDVANAFLVFREAFPDEDLSELIIRCIR